MDRTPYRPTVILQHVVKPGRAFPLIGDTVLTESKLSGRLFRVTVKRVTELRWRRDGSVVMEIRGPMEPVESEASA